MGPEDMAKLEKALKNNIEIVSFVGKRNDYFKYTRALFTYLYDHQTFNKLIVEARKKLGIPVDGFERQEQGFHWQFSNKRNSEKIRTIAENIVSEFNIDASLISPTRFFTKDF